MKRISVVDKAFRRLKGFCEKQVNCEKCRFDNYGDCALEAIPANWEMPVKKKEIDNE